jgi:hypothetical protein
MESFAPLVVVKFYVFRLWLEFTWLPVIAVLPSQSNPPSFWMRRVFIRAHGVAEQGRPASALTWGVKNVLLFWFDLI